MSFAADTHENVLQHSVPNVGCPRIAEVQAIPLVDRGRIIYPMEISSAKVYRPSVEHLDSWEVRCECAYGEPPVEQTPPQRAREVSVKMLDN
eukprot:7460177-Pyramimonas_sp.AAC.1